MTYRTVTVKVERCDIRGAGRVAWDNPIARAIRRRLRKPPAVRVFSWVGRVLIGDRCFQLPPAVDAADSNFSRTGQMEPFCFDLSNESICCDDPKS